MYTILRLKKVTEKTGLAKSTIYKKIAEKEFPQQISLGGKAVGWLKGDVDRWIEQKIAETVNDNGQQLHVSSIIQIGSAMQPKPANDN